MQLIKHNNQKVFIDKSGNFDKVAKGELAYYNGYFVPFQAYLKGSYKEKLTCLKNAIQELKSYNNRILCNNVWVQVQSTIFDKQLEILEQAKPQAKTFEQIQIKAISKEAKTIRVNDSTLKFLFKSYLQNLPSDNFLISDQWDIRSLYLDGNRCNNGSTPQEKARIKSNAKEEGERLFTKFLNGSEEENKECIVAQWNTKVNNVLVPKLDLDFTCKHNSSFKDKPFSLRQCQKEALALLQISGNAIISLDTGMGKTPTAILWVKKQLEMGYCQRPLVIVPNSTYKKWLRETRDLLPKTKINDFYNLGTNIEATKIEDGSITFVTFEGMEKIGFRIDTYNNLHKRFIEILGQGTGRIGEQVSNKIDKMVSYALDSINYRIEDFGFDSIIADEAHAFKNLFTDVKNGDGAKSYHITGSQSTRAIKFFCLSQYVNFVGGNICLLTATPFNNSPLEIYTMLSYVAYGELQKLGINSLQDFFDLFVLTTTDLVATATLSFKRKEVVKSFQNVEILQAILSNYLIYRSSSDDQEIQKLLPNKSEFQPKLALSNLQAKYMQDIEFAVSSGSFEFIKNANIDNSEATDEKDEALEVKDQIKGFLLKAISLMRSVAFSPYLFPYHQTGFKDCVEFVENSPKILWTCEAIKSIIDSHRVNNTEISGQVIYSNLGVNYFRYIKEYLILKCSLSDKEVGIITGKQPKAKNEQIKEDFLTGKVKVLIGSSTIKEGVDLQDKSTTLYNLCIDWNPTESKQVNGRIHRQGNIYANIRIITPLMQNSADLFLLQKNEEKSDRINDLFSNLGATFILDDFNPNTLKMAIITDPKKLLEVEIDSLEQVKRVEMYDIFTKLNEVKKYNQLELDRVRLLAEMTERVIIKEGGKNLTIEQVLECAEQLYDRESYSNRSIIASNYLEHRAVVRILSTLNPNQTTEDLEAKLEQLRTELKDISSEENKDKILAKIRQEQKEAELDKKTFDYYLSEFSSQNNQMLKLRGETITTEPVAVVEKIKIVNIESKSTFFGKHEPKPVKVKQANLSEDLFLEYLF